MRRFLYCILVFLMVFLAGCAPDRAEVDAQITAIAAEVLSTQSAQITKTARVIQATQTAFVPPTPTPLPTPTLGVGSTRISEVDGMTQVFVPGGEYMLGSSNQEIEEIYQVCLENFQNKRCVKENYQDELPQHTVSIDEFWIDQTEVTNAMFARFVNATGYQTTAEMQTFAMVYRGGNSYEFLIDAYWRQPTGPESSLEGLENHPVINVSWYDAWSYCNWAGRRLATEAEWEAAARGENGFLYPWGNDLPNDLTSNLADINFPLLAVRVDTIDDGWVYTAPVSSYPAGDSPFGAQDMAGNVAEWVYDGYAPDFAALPGSRNPVYLEDLEQRSVRGGHFASMIVDGHASNRFGYPPLTGVNNLGFRCASSNLVLPDPPAQDIYFNELILLSSTHVWSIDEGELEGILGTLKSGKDVQVVAMHDNCAYLKIISPEFPDGGWIMGPTVDKDIIFLPPCDGLDQVFFRPKNNAQMLGLPGNYLKKELRFIDSEWKLVDVKKGVGVLKITNLGAEDAFFSVLRLEGKNNSPYGVYVRTGETSLLTDLIDGEYEVYMTTGRDFGFGRMGFDKNPSYAKMDKTITIRASSGQTYWTIVVQPAEAGNVSQTPIGPDDFPR